MFFIHISFLLNKKWEIRVFYDTGNIKQEQENSFFEAIMASCYAEIKVFKLLLQGDSVRSRSIFDIKRVGLIVGVGCILLFLASSWWRERCLHVVTYPLLLVERHVAAPVKRWVVRQQGVDQLQALTEKYMKERNDAWRKLIELRGTRDYLLDCAECIEFKKRYETKNSLAVQILLRQFSQAGHYFFVDAGENRGIKKDMVVVYDNCLVGRVTEVYPHYSKVLLVSDKDCHVAVRCVETGARGIYSGMNDGTKGVIEFVNHLDLLRVGDLVLSQGEGLIFPRGFALGKVTSFELEGVQYRVFIEPIINMQDLKFCVILLGEGIELSARGE